jgi:ferric-dicitrate binding protein FerR (iron transport regulator)
MPPANPTLQQLFAKYLDETITPAELEQLYRLIDGPAALDQLDHLLAASFADRDQHYPVTSAAERQEMLAGLLHKIDAAQEEQEKLKEQPPLRRLIVRRILASAAVLLAVAVALWLLGKKPEPAPPAAVQPVAKTTDIPAPTGARATLTLAGGQRILLDSAGSGPLAMQGRTQIDKLPSGQIAYRETGATGDVVLYNTLSTTRGGQSTILLPDGTRVWLNALSSLRFPTAFGADRTVELDGEAYFEVHTDKNKPFVVQLSDRSRIQVLGTHFNVNAYPDEPTFNTTLLEGSVKINGADNTDSIVIRPGEQAQGRANRLVVDKHVNLDNVMAWKNGYFSFDGSNIEAIMRQVSRWYGVKVVYEGDVKAERFAGYLPRSVHISQLLDVLSLTKTVKFTIQDQTITVKPYRS